MALFSSSTVILALALLHSSVNAHALPSNNIRNKRAADFDYSDQVTIIGDGLPRCAGTIINPFHVLTARGCVLYPNEDFIANIVVIAGTPDLHKHDLKRRIYGYPSTITVDKGYDIALLRVDFGFYMEPGKNPLKLSNYDEISPGDKVFVTSMEVDEGDYVTSTSSDPTNQAYPVRLRLAEMYLQNASLCAKYWGKDFDGYTQQCNDFIKKHPGIHRNTYVGGGVFRNNRLVGVVSYKTTRLGSVAKEPAVFTTVWRFYWIKEAMKRHVNSETVQTCDYDLQGKIKGECHVSTYKPAPGAGLF